MCRLLPILVGFLLAACANQHVQTQAEADRAAAAAAAKDAADAASDAATCQSSGFQPNTPSYYRCLDSAEAAREHQDGSDRAALAGRLLGRPPPWWQ